MLINYKRKTYLFASWYNDYVSKYILSKPDMTMIEEFNNYRHELIVNNSSSDGTNRIDSFDDMEKWFLDTMLYEKIETCPPGMSIGFQYVYIDEDTKQIVGMIQLRPDALNHPYLKQFGGHIGYSVLPSKRRQGIGNMMLKEFLKIAFNEYKLDRVLITCFEDNEASRRIILANNGAYESSINYPPENKNIERYWIENK